MAGLLLGLEDYVDQLLASPDISNFYLGGFKRITGDRKVFLAQAAMISRVSEGVLQELLEDPRVAKQYATLWEVVSQEMHWLCTLPQVSGECYPLCWTLMVKHGSRCIVGGHVSMRFSGGGYCRLPASSLGNCAGVMCSRTSLTWPRVPVLLSLSLQPSGNCGTLDFQGNSWWTQFFYWLT